MYDDNSYQGYYKGKHFVGACDIPSDVLNEYRSISKNSYEMIEHMNDSLRQNFKELFLKHMKNKFQI